MSCRGGDAETLKEWIELIFTAVGTEILITDDADGVKTVADELRLDHQVCKGHVKRNTETLIESLKSAAAQDEDGSLSTIGITPEQAVADLKRPGELILSRQPKEQTELETMHCCYLEAAPVSASQWAP